MTDKPRHRSGYTSEETELVRSACLTVAVTLGAYLDDVVIVGGLVPSLLIDGQRAESDEPDDHHPGTNDLDLGLSLAVLDDQRYTEISARLRAEGFEPDENAAGNPTVQRWRRGELKVDFLMPPAPGQDPTRRVQNLEPDFGALVTRGLELAFNERVQVTILGRTLSGEEATREVPVCGPGAFIVLKAFAFADRSEPKDAFDLIYVIRSTPDGAVAVATRLKEHAATHHGIVDEAIAFLARDFDTPEHLGPRRAADFDYVEGDDLDAAAADAHGYVDDLIKAYSSGPEFS
jgi:hypothetical protein